MNRYAANLEVHATVAGSLPLRPSRWSAMNLDLRYPLGMLFTAFGVLLVGYGLLRPEERAVLAVVNVNLYAGLSMLVFGVAMLWLARRAELRGKSGAGS
jgi:hypothetical protein